MEINNEVKKQLEKQINQSIDDFKAIEFPHILFTEIFSELDKIDKEAARQDFIEQLEHYCSTDWTNPDEGMNPDEKLDALLFEYDDPCGGAFSAAYGIVGSGFKVKSVPYLCGSDYGFASGMDATYGVRLKPLSPLDKVHGKEYEGVEFWEEDGYFELLGAFVNTTCLILHEAVSVFVKGETFKKMNITKIFKIVICEHDSDVQPIYFVYENEADILAEIKAQGESIDKKLEY
jgi:hypothetical protein